MAHAALPAAAVVVAEPAFAAAERVAGEDEQVLQPLVPLARRAHRRYRLARPPVSGRDAAVGCEVVVIGKVADVYACHQLGFGPGADPRDGRQACVGFVSGEQRRYLGVEPGRLLRGLPDAPGKHLHLRILRHDPVLRRSRRCGRRRDRRVDAGPVRAAGHGPDGRLSRVDDAPGAAQGLHHPQPMGVRQVGQRLEFRAAFQEDAPEPVLAAGGAGDHVASLRRHRPCGLEPFAVLRHGQERVGDAEGRLGDDGGVPLVRLRCFCSIRNAPNAH